MNSSAPPASAVSRGSAVAPHFASIRAAEQARYATDPDPGGAYVYARFGTAASRRLEHRYTELLDASWATVSASGTAAIDNAISAGLLARPGSRTVLVTEGLYVGTRRYFERILGELRGVEVVTAPFVARGTDSGAFASIVERARPAVVFTESVTNPFLAVGDLAAMARACHAHDAPLVVDATVTPPPNASALAEGADLVVHSATKYLNGRNDVLAGVVAGRSDTYRQATSDYRRMAGAMLGDTACERLLDDADSVPARFAAQADNAGRAAALLRSHPRVAEVWATDPGPGGPRAALVTVALAAADGAPARAACDAVVAAGYPAVPFSTSFGSAGSTLTLVGLLDREHADRPYLRLSCGTEPWDELRPALERAFAAAEGAERR